MARILTRRRMVSLAAASAAGVFLGKHFFGGPGEHVARGVASIDAGGGEHGGIGAGSVPASSEIVNAGKLKQSFEQLGKYIYLTPEKLGGGTHAVDLDSGRTLAWINYWNYGDSCPISHHLAAYPSPDPYKGFDFVNSTQGGDNIMIYGLPTQIKAHGLLDKWGQGNHIYRVNFDGSSMNLVEDVAETTGIGLGVHITILPDASGFASADGQKDVAAFFDRVDNDAKTTVQMAFRADWIGKESTGAMDDNWAKGGTLRIVRLTKAKETGKYDYYGTRGNKIDWEMVPMGEYLVYTGQLPGSSPRTLSGLDAVVHHPANRYSALIIRMCSAAVIIDRENWEPVACLHNPEGSPGNLKVTKVSSNPDTWDIKFDDIKCVGHEAGFSPDGKNFTMMNNIKQNNMAVYDTADPNPTNWKKITYVKDGSWVGDYPSPFHLCFSMDGSKMFVSVLYPKPANSGTCVVDTKTWTIIKKFQNVGPDCQTMSVTYDGKYVFQIFSGLRAASLYTHKTHLNPWDTYPILGGITIV